MSSLAATPKSFSFLETTGVMQGEVPLPLKCPICIEVPLAEVYQCKNGHVICKSCQRECIICPQCRIPFQVDGQLIRNLALEALLDMLLLSCTYKPLGCGDLVKRTEMKEHLINCKYNGKSINLCHLLGYNCDYWISTLNPFGALCHFYQKHEAKVSFDNNPLTINFEIDLDSRTAGDRYLNGVWKPVLMSIEQGYFMIIMSVNCTDKSISWTCLDLNESKRDNNMEVEFQLKSKSKGVPAWIFKIPAVPVLDSTQVIQTPIFRTPINIIKDHYWEQRRRNGTLKLNVSITPKSNVNNLTGTETQVVTVCRVAGGNSSNQFISD